MERLLRVMNQLAGTTLKSTKEIANTLCCSERTVYRYIDSLQSAGFTVIKRFGTTFQLIATNGRVPDPHQLVRFTEEEAAVIGRLLHCLDSGNALREDLLLKRRQVILHDYASSNSGQLKDYLVEPFALGVNFSTVAAYDLKCDCNKIFKIARIGRVETLMRLWCKEKFHEYPVLDAFRMSGCTPMKVKLALTLRARNLLLEEYPLSEGDISQEDGRWIYEGTVRTPEGVGRFVLGLLHEVEILEGDALRQYVYQRCLAGLERVAPKADAASRG